MDIANRLVNPFRNETHAELTHPAKQAKKETADVNRTYHRCLESQQQIIVLVGSTHTVYLLGLKTPARGFVVQPPANRNKTLAPGPNG